MTFVRYFSLIGFVLLCNISLVSAQENCALRTNMVKTLERTYGEILIAFGIAGGGGILELFVDYEDRSWTILITQTNGISCIGASGRDFEFTFATAKGDKS